MIEVTNGLSVFLGLSLSELYNSNAISFSLILGVEEKKIIASEAIFDNGYIGLKFYLEESVEQGTALSVAAKIGSAENEEKIIVKGKTDKGYSAQAYLGIKIDFVNALSSDSLVCNPLITTDFKIEIDKTEYVLIAKADSYPYDYISITAKGITLKIWNYEDASVVWYENDFGTESQTFKIPITHENKGLIEFQVKGKGEITELVLCKGDI
ncbi:MAG: hypothetical protein UIG52_06875 [Bacteroidales bacterium]|nr:hypothetical protein [Bacteroidales bacterium]